MFLSCNPMVTCFHPPSGIVETLPRLTAMIRGIGNPLVAAYARAYLCRVRCTSYLLSFILFIFFCLFSVSLYTVFILNFPLDSVLCCLWLSLTQPEIFNIKRTDPLDQHRFDLDFDCCCFCCLLPGGHGSGPPPQRQPQPQLLRPAQHVTADQQRERPEPAGPAAGGGARVLDALFTRHQLDPAVHRLQSSGGKQSPSSFSWIFVDLNCRL